jgi:hypothetical protein
MVPSGYDITYSNAARLSSSFQFGGLVAEFGERK